MNKPTFDAMVAQYAVQEASGEGVASWDNGVRCVLPEVLIGGKAVQNGTPTPDAPVMPEFSSGTTVVSRGKNLIDMDKFIGGIVEKDGDWIVLTKAGDARFGKWIDVHLPDGEFMCQVDSIDTPMTDNPTILIQLMYEDGSYGTITLSSYATYILRDKITKRMRLYQDMSAPDGVYRAKNIQMELGTTATPYTPYFDGGTAVAPELLAIPGTEYRDEWDAQTGKGVRRCAVIAGYAGEAINAPYISSTGTLSEGAYVIYGIPDTPFQTDAQPLIAPKGTGHIMQVGGTLDAVPITAKYVTHS